VLDTEAYPHEDGVSLRTWVWRALRYAGAREMNLAMDNLSSGDLHIDVVDAPSALRLEWRGKSTSRHPAHVLEPFLTPVIEEAARRGSFVEMHFEKLAHFNSSTIGCLIHAIEQARTQGVKMVLVYDDRLAWQRLSFDALRVFVKEDVLELTVVRDG
jgi:hypothetical protein